MGSFPLPNGGMTDEQIKEYLKKNLAPKPMLDDSEDDDSSDDQQNLKSSKNDIDDSEDSSDDNDTDNSNDDSEDNDDSDNSNIKLNSNTEKQQLIDKLNKFTGKTPVDSKMNTSDVIQKLLGEQQTQLNDAKSQRNNLQLMALLEHAGETANAGLNPLSGEKPDNQFTQKLLEAANQPLQDIASNNAIQKQALQDVALQQGLKNETAKEDPNSDVSKIARQIAQSSAKSAGLNVNIPDNISLSNLEKIMPGIETMANKHFQIQARADLQQDAMETKADQKQNQSLVQAQQLLESARGNPEVQQALKDRYSASKALKLINSQYDPNNLSPTQVKLITSEVSKIAQGGVPTVSELESLNPNTLKNRFASIAQNVINKPTAANAGEFIKQYKDYLNELNDNAQNVVNDKFGRVIESRKNQLGDVNYNNLKDLYLKSNKEQSNQTPKYDQDVLIYAQKHNITPDQSQQIKLSRTQGQ